MRLVREGKLTPEQAEELLSLASRDIGILAINILMSFGVIAVAAGILALKPTFATGAAIGALLLSGGVIGALDGGFTGLAFTAILLLVLAVVICSSVLMALVPLALAGALGSSTGYFHATYMLIVSEPTITIMFFALLALAAYLVGNRVGPAYEGLATVFARMSLVLGNFGFWVGSLWGDHPGESWAVGGTESWAAREAWEKSALHVPGWAFTAAWAVLVIGVGIWAARANRRWVVTTAATFGAINLYTQWFALSARAKLAPVGWRISDAPDLGAEPRGDHRCRPNRRRDRDGFVAVQHRTCRRGPFARGRCIAGTERWNGESSVNWMFPRSAWAARR